MRQVLLFLSCAICLFANPSVTENDPSTLVSGVSVITGDLYTYDEDFVVAGVQPIPIRRCYLSSKGDWTPYEHLCAVYLHEDRRYMIPEVNGTTLYYQVPELSFEENKKDEPVHCQTLIPKETGISNTASGQISARTNYKNQLLIVEKGRKWITLFAANGTKRHYKAMRNQKGTEATIFYPLRSEELPNGQVLEYKWDEEYHLTAIISRSGKGSRYAILSIPEWKNKHPPKNFTMSGTDHQTIRYEWDYLSKDKKNWVLKAVEPPDEPKKQFTHCLKTSSQREQVPYLEKISLPNGRAVSIEYEEYKNVHSVTRYRVKRLYEPIGSDSTLHVTHTFFYFPEARHSYVIDAKGNKTAYFWNQEKRLTRIDRFAGMEELITRECFEWEGTNIRSKSLLDQDQKPIWIRAFEYDERGNVVTETFSDELSEWPLFNKYVKKTTFSDDGRNLPLREEEPGGRVTLFTYHSNTHLLKTKILCDHDVPKISTSYEYNVDLLLICEITDDGLTKTIRQITPKKQEPFYGMPEVIEEKTEENGDEILLSKTILHYGVGGRVIKKDIFDAKNVHRYSLHYSYDAKGRLLRETNALGWESLSNYDSVGNRIYFKDFSGLETDYEYDASNRLIKKEERGKDGLRLTSTYEYDATHKVIRETDPRGANTHYILTPHGKRAETHFPPFPSETGALITPVARSSFDSAGNEIVSTDADGFFTHTKYNAYSKPLEIRHPDGTIERLQYTVNGDLKSHMDTAGVLTTFTYDYLRRIVCKTISQKKTVLAEETYKYEGRQLISKTDAEGNRTLYTYDRAGRKSSETYGGETTVFHYDEFSRNHCVEKGSIRTVQVFNLLNWVEEIREEDIATNQLLRRTIYRYDQAGNKIATLRWIDAAPVTEQCEYDSQNRLLSKTDPSGEKETLTYNDQFINTHQQKVLQKTHTDPMGLQTIDTFDTHGRIVKTEQVHKGHILSVEEKHRSASGKNALQINTVLASNGTSRTVRTRYEYDAMGRPIALIEAEGSPNQKITRTAYTPRGEKQTITKPDGTIITFSYTPLGHLESILSSDRTVKHLFRHNKLGALIWHDGIQRAHDAKGRLLEERFPDYTIQNRYNHLGQRVECKCPQANLFLEYTYRGYDMASVTRKSRAGDMLYTHQYQAYDLSGNLLASRLPNDLGEIRVQYDPNSRRKSIEAPSYSQEVLEIDKVGNILSLSTRGELSTFAYDELYQLTSESGIFTHSYRYDSLYCRLAKDTETYEINDLNQVVSEIEYDKNGNPRKQGDILYTFDALDRLIKLETPEYIQIYTYDSQHRRLHTTTTSNSGYSVQHFIYDGQNEIGTFDEEFQVVDLRILGRTLHAEIDASIALELQGTYFVPIHDLSGNIAALLPFDKAEPQTLFYSAFGEEKGSLQSPWRFSSKRVDITGLIYYGRRFYQPSLGRWLSPDPAGFTNGMNLYAFVNNCPLTHFDEYGLELTGPTNQWWAQPEPWRNLGSWQQQSWQKMSFDYGMQTRLIFGPRYSPISQIWRALGANSDASPVYFVNGIANTPKSALVGAMTLQNTLDGLANVIPAFDQSHGTFKDLVSVFLLKNPRYMTDSIRSFKRHLENEIAMMDLANDPRKIFLVGFSRGGGKIFRATEGLTPQQKERLIILACGPTMILPRNLGYKVTNLISTGDWYSLACNTDAIKPNVKSYADVVFLPAKDSNGWCGDHFFQSRTYQEGINEHMGTDYKLHGILK